MRAAVPMCFLLCLLAFELCFEIRTLLSYFDFFFLIRIPNKVCIEGGHSIDRKNTLEPHKTR